MKSVQEMTTLIPNDAATCNPKIHQVVRFNKMGDDDDTCYEAEVLSTKIALISASKVHLTLQEKQGRLTVSQM